MSPDAPAPPVSFPRERVDQIEDLVKKYTAFIKPGTVSPTNGAAKEHCPAVVLLTGSTGTLGSHILQYLIDDARVQGVYTLDRQASTPLHDRQAIPFRNHSLDLTALSSNKLVSLQGNLLDTRFGLDLETYRKV